MRMTIDDLILRVGKLPPLPQAAQKALELIRSPKSSMAQVANVLAMDEALTSMVLRWANSAYYGLIRPVSTVQQAVIYLGQITVESLILTASVSSYLDRTLPGYSLGRGDLWKHAIAVASGARLAAANQGRKFAEEAYHAGLLCDIGKLAFDVLLRDVNTAAPEWQGRSFTELERTCFGVDHALLGAEIARRWKLPDSLITTIACHHHPAQAGKYWRLASAVHVADAAAMMMGIGIGKDGLQYELDPSAFQLLGWHQNNLAELFERIGEMVKQAEDFIGFMRQ